MRASTSSKQLKCKRGAQNCMELSEAGFLDVTTKSPIADSKSSCRLCRFATMRHVLEKAAGPPEPPVKSADNSEHSIRSKPENEPAVLPIEGQSTSRSDPLSFITHERYHEGAVEVV